MQLTKPELLILEQIANGNKAVKTIATALKKSDKQIYVTAKKLAEKGLIERLDGILEPKRTAYLSLLLQLLAKIPNLPVVLADSGIPIFTAMLNPVTLEDIKAETGFKETTIFGKLRHATRRSMVKKRVSTYELNSKLWTLLERFLIELKEYEETTDERIPASSVIYYKKKNEIVFSSKEELDAPRTAFSAYVDYGIELMTITNYYYLPKKRLTKEDILLHSLYVVEKEMDIRNMIFIALFYAKFKKEFKIKHPILMNLSAVLAGGEIKGYTEFQGNSGTEKTRRFFMYPKYQEIKDRAEVYDIEV